MEVEGVFKIAALGVLDTLIQFTSGISSTSTTQLDGVSFENYEKYSGGDSEKSAVAWGLPR